METSRPPSLSSSACSGQNPLPPKCPLQFIFPLNPDHFSGCTAGSHGFSEPSEGEAHHHRASSDTFLTEQPPWLEELLDEPETTPSFRASRRSSSYSTFLDVVADSRKEDINIVPVSRFSIRRTSNWQKAGGSAPSKAIIQQDHEVSSQKRDGSNANPSASKADAKRAKQQYAHRSRLTKLQYIAELERTVQILQAEGSQVSAALEYLDQQVVILGMENQALKQRLDGLSHKQHIKYLEKDLLERELARLQFVYHQQQQQQQQQQKQNHSANNL